VVRHDVQDELVHAQDPLVLLARVGVPAANDNQVERGRVREVVGLLGRVEEREDGIGGHGADGADVRGPDVGDEGRLVRVEQDGDPQRPVECRAHVE
jgi:hypothetical protein